MKTKRIVISLIVIAFITSCKKSDPSNNANIDVSAQWQIDAYENVILGLADGQWQGKSFTAYELSLFSSLDTTNLSGTTTPMAVLDNSARHNSIYPNPFNSNQFYFMKFGFTTGYTGQFVLKSVLVDSQMKPLIKTVARLQAVWGPGNTSTSYPIGISYFGISPGRYRLYYTLSSQANPHFFKCWGNVQEN